MVWLVPTGGFCLDYFEECYNFAVKPIKDGKDMRPIQEEISDYRTLTEPGKKALTGTEVLRKTLICSQE